MSQPITKIVTFKNSLLVGDATKKIEFKDVKMTDLPKGQLQFFVNTQWLSKDNRIKFNIMSKGHEVTTNNVSPKIVTDIKTYFDVAQQPKTSTRGTTMEMSKEDVKKLNELLTTYNKATLTTEIIKLTLSL